MIDLKELERRLDEALAKETSESLSSWLLNQRKDNLESFLGAGCLAKFRENPYSFSMDLPKDAIYNGSIDNSPSEFFANAA